MLTLTAKDTIDTNTLTDPAHRSYPIDYLKGGCGF
jgi:hypothetical protein